MAGSIALSFWAELQYTHFLPVGGVSCWWSLGKPRVCLSHLRLPWSCAESSGWHFLYPWGHRKPCSRFHASDKYTSHKYVLGPEDTQLHGGSSRQITRGLPVVGLGGAGPHGRRLCCGLEVTLNALVTCLLGRSEAGRGPFHLSHKNPASLFPVPHPRDCGSQPLPLGWHIG